MRFLKLVFILLFIAVPLVASADKAKTIDELAKMYDSSKCKGCHEDIYKQWENSHHARPLMGVKGGLMLTPLAKAKGTAFSPDDPKKATLKNYPCFKCHLPQAIISAEDSVAVELTEALLTAADEKASDDAKKAAKGKVAKLQITCIVCHNTNAIIHKRELGEPKEGVLYSSKAVDSHPDKIFKKVDKSAIFKDSVYCGQCHGLGPNLEFDQAFQCANLYGSYLHSYIPSGGTQTCQSCHMQKGDHLIAPNFNDEKGTSELLTKAISLDVQTLGYEWLKKAGEYVSKVVVNTKITTSAGHRIPDGWPSHNRVVMVVTAKTADGKEVGKVEKHYHPQATNCRDTKMKYGAQWKVANLRDTSLQPAQAKKESIEFDIAKDVRAVDVTVELFYEATTPAQKYPIHTVTKKVSLDR